MPPADKAFIIGTVIWLTLCVLAVGAVFYLGFTLDAGCA